jgi:hypothetical protein
MNVLKGEIFNFCMKIFFMHEKNGFRVMFVKTNIRHMEYKKYTEITYFSQMHFPIMVRSGYLVYSIIIVSLIVSYW